jgi:glycerol-3-phosphate cytidylyltransferase
VAAWRDGTGMDVLQRFFNYGKSDAVSGQTVYEYDISAQNRFAMLGDYLVVALSTDEFNWNEKQKKCYFPYEERKRMLEAIRYVDLVIPEENWEQKKTDVEKFQIDTFVMGNDWEGKFDFLKDLCEVVYLPRTPEISTTKIKSDLNKK